jgi:hypothetical protein
MIRKAIIIKKPHGIACQDIKSTGSASLRNIWVQEKCWMSFLGQKMVFTITFSNST